MRLLRALLVASAMMICGHAQAEQEAQAQGNGGVPAWRELSLREKIGQTVMMKTDLERFKGIGGGSLERFFKKYPIGGMFMAHWEYDNPRTDKNVATLIRQQVRRYQEASAIPLIIAEDYECGVGGSLAGFTHMPRIMALGATQDPKLAYNHGRAIALQAKSMGVHWLFHPVADLSFNRHSPIVSTRAMTDDPSLAVRLLAQQIKGMQDLKVAATIKHFPGDGVSSFDQHLTTTHNSLPLKQWRDTFGMVYGELIKQGVFSVMIGHITLPSYQKERVDGFLLPGTLSRELMMELLKGELDFSGLVLSDALEMAGFYGYYDTQVEREIASFVAGTDMMLWPSLEYIDVLEERIIKGEIPIERLDDAVARVWALKQKCAVFAEQQEYELTAEDKRFIKSSARQVAEKGVTLINDRYEALPLRPQKGQELLLVVVSAEDRTAHYETTKKLFERQGYTVELTHNLSMRFWGEGLKRLNKYARVILCLDYHPHQPLGNVYPSGDEAMSIWLANKLPLEKLVVVSYGNPYLIPSYFERAPLTINAYSHDATTQEAVVKALLGKIKLQGVSPVKLAWE